LLRRREGREFESEKAGTETKWWHKLMAAVHLKRQATARKMPLSLPPPPPGVIPDLDGFALAGNERTQETFLSFSAYTEGKSVVRLDRHGKPPMPLGLHSFTADSGEMLRYEQAQGAGDPVILHYPNASFAYWKEKYERLGEVPATQSGDRNVPRTHIASSQVARRGQRHQQELFYKTFVMQSEHGELAYLAEHGLVMRVDGVKALLEYYDQPREAPEVLPGQVVLRDLQTGMKFGKV